VFKYFVSGAETRTLTNICNEYNIYQKVHAFTKQVRNILFAYGSKHIRVMADGVIII